MTLGETRVRTDFNPSNSDLVSQLKQKAAEYINLVNTIPTPEVGTPQITEVGRLKALALTAAEEAAMWAVKAATAK